MYNAKPQVWKWTKIVIPLILAAIFGALSVAPALAVETCSVKTNFAGTGSTAKGCKDSYTSADGVYWKGRMNSYMSPAVNIDRIGWWWWTNQQWCGGDLYAQYDYGGSVGYGRSNWASTSPWQKNHLCIITNEGKVNGKHDFQKGQTNWSPSWTRTISLPTYKDP